ncbi:MAG: CRISPR-associated protein Cas4 [Thermoplasmata archaeon]|nr:MAG: CRISPR-associated protein Cas4 [Thermoplasmata archaeon]
MRKNEMPAKKVSASDVEKYGYCPLSWWLSEQGAHGDDESLRRGSKQHAEIGNEVKKIKKREEFSRESERSVLWFSLIAIVIGVNAVAIVYSAYAPQTQGRAVTILLSIIAVLWVIVALLFFYTGMKSEKIIRGEDGVTTSREGTIEDEKAVEAIEPYLDWRQIPKEARWTTLAFFIVSGVLALHGVIILVSFGNIYSDILSNIFIIMALIWLIGSAFFYIISLRREFRAKKSSKIATLEGRKQTFTDSEISVVLFALIATVLASNSLTIYQNPHTVIGMIIMIVAIVWLYGGFAFLYTTFRANLKLRLLIIDHRKIEERASKKKLPTASNLEYAIEEGAFEYERAVIWFAAVAMVLALNAIIMNFSESIEELRGSIIAHIFVIVALIWLIGASFFLYMVLRYSHLAIWLRQKHGIEEGSIEYVDADGENPNILVSNKYSLRGRPDYILRRGSYLIPVEVKTGRVPRGPLFSHILQLAAYCLLIEDKYNSAPPYGIIRYSNAQHEIDYTEDLKNILTAKLKDMREIMEKGVAHRNHNRPNKCKGCSRRDICSEKLA